MSFLSRRVPPERSVPSPATFSIQRPLVASAHRVQLSDKRELDLIKKRQISDVWQEEAWEYFDVIGEIKYAFTLVGNVTSRVRLFAATSVEEDEPPISVEDADKLSDDLKTAARASLKRLAAANGGMPGLLRDAAMNLAVAGECYLIQTPEDTVNGVPEKWDIRSVSELIVGQSGKMQLKTARYLNHNDYTDIDSGAFVGRIWRPHPRFSDEADSSLRALRDICDEILLIARTVRATARSRLNAGALFVPDGLSVAASEEQDSQVLVDGEPTVSVEGEETDEFEEELVEAMTTPIADEESASAVVPLLIRGPAELGEKIKPIKFERAFDAALTQRADKLLERLMQGIDVPKDIVTGLANVKYSNATQIDESLYKAHIEPLVLLLCDALTVVFLRPALKAAGFTADEARKVIIWFDPTEILTRPDRAQDANDGYDRYALSDEAWRRHHGFPETDAPSDEEVAMRIAINRMPIGPDLATGMLELLVPGLMQKIRQQSIANSPAPLSPHAQQVLGGPYTGSPGPAPDETPQAPQPGAPSAPSAPATPLPPEPISRQPSPLPKEAVPAR